MLVYPDGTIAGTIGGGEVESRVIKEAIDALSNGEPKIVGYDLVDPEQGDPGICGGRLEVFIDPLGTPDEILVVGGGHVGKAVVHLAKWMGYRVILNDDREEYCRPDVIPDADKYIHCKLEEITNHLDINERTAVVLATRSHQVDISGLPEILAEPIGYIGVISSKRRWKLTMEQLLNAGVKKDVLKKIHAPIGLDIKAETPEEIALSIMAEIVQEKRRGS